MNVTIIGAGNSGLTMAAHLGSEGERVTLWNRSTETIRKLMETGIIYSKGKIEGAIKIDLVTDDIQEAVENPDIIFITTPASSHKEIARLVGQNIRKETIIVLSPGRTLGAMEFQKEYRKYNSDYEQDVCETQTIIYTCRKTDVDSVSLISLKKDVLISCMDKKLNKRIIEFLPSCIREYFSPARSMIETSIGNVGMILHCAPLLLNTGWTENYKNIYKYYYDGITPSIAKLLEKMDKERVAVSRKLGLEVETTKEWMKRTYNIEGEDLYECIQNNEAYEVIDAPESLNHRYIYEDLPCGLVPLESIGNSLGLEMETTKLIIDLASMILEKDFRYSGRSLKSFSRKDLNEDFRKIYSRRDGTQT